ncbi:MAG: hypothetical protein RLZZ271_347 [Pseudomonadota bacterium]
MLHETALLRRSLCAAISVFMSLIQSPAFLAGKYLITPMTRMADSGLFNATVSIRSGQGSGTHDRIYTFKPEFDMRESALTYAAAQGRELLPCNLALA